MSLFTPLVAAAAAAVPPAGNPLIQFIPFLGIMVVFYFFLIRPQQQQRKKHMEMIENVKRGDEVVTAGGLVGKVTKVSEGPEITVRLAEGVEVTAIKMTLTDVRGKTEPAKS